MADTLFKDGFNETGNWEYIADDVMGGVSKGKVQFKKIDGTHDNSHITITHPAGKSLEVMKVVSAAMD